MWHFDKCRLRRACEPHFNLWNCKWCSASSFTFIEYSSDRQRLWSDCAYVQAVLVLCWPHTPHCRKAHAAAHIVKIAHNSWTAWYNLVKFCIRMHINIRLTTVMRNGLFHGRGFAEHKSSRSWSTSEPTVQDVNLISGLVYHWPVECGTWNKMM